MIAEPRQAAPLSLWSPDSIRHEAVLVASCPGGYGFGQAVVAAGRARFDQELLGYGAQIRLFAALLQRAGRRLHIVAAPEIFSSDESFRHFARAVGRHKWPAEIIHFRFGMPGGIRLLKRATNVVVCAEPPGRQDLVAPAHPFADGLTLPQSVRLVLRLDPAPRAAPLRTVDGRRCAQARLTLPLAAQAARETPLTRRGATGPAILLPWNVAFAASIIPDLVRKLAALQQGGAALPPIVLLPYNCCPELESIPAALARQVRQRRAGAVAFARVAAAGLQKRFALAWLEAGDPEHAWNHSRLAALRLPAALIATPDGAPGGGRFAVAADRFLLVNRTAALPDAAGVAAGLSLRAVRRLLRETSRVSRE